MGKRCAMTNGPEARPTAAGDADPYTEPPNSTVDDWIGQSVQRDAELAEKLVKEADGDLRKAEEEYERESDQGASTNQAANRPTDEASARGRTQE